MKRALAFLTGLSLAAAALYALLTATAPPTPAPPSTGSEASPAGSAEIDEASRRELEAVLRKAAEEP